MSTNYFPNGYEEKQAISWGVEDLSKLFTLMPDGRLVWVQDSTLSTASESLAWNTDGSIVVKKLNGVFDVRAAGAKGDGVTDDTAIIQAVIDAAAVSGGIVSFGPGTYKCTSALTLKSNSHLVGAGKGITILDFSTFAPTSGVIIGSGSKGTVNLLTGNVAQGATSVDITDGTLVTPGQEMLLASEEGFHGNPGITFYKGEIVKVDSVSVNHVVLRSRTFDSYTTGTNAGLSPITYITNISIKDLTVRREAQTAVGKVAINLNWVKGFLVKDVGVEYGTTAGINIQNTLDAEVTGCTILHSWFTNTSSSNSVIVTDASMYVRVHDNYMQHARTAFNTGKGGSGIGGIPRFVTVTNNIFDSEDENHAFGGMETHLSSEYILFSGNIGRGTVKGPVISTDSYNTLITGNILYGIEGIIVGASTTATILAATNTLISGNIVVTAGQTAATPAIRIKTSHIRAFGNMVSVESAIIGNVGTDIFHPVVSNTVSDVHLLGNSYKFTGTLSQNGIRPFGLQGGSLIGNSVYRPGAGTAIFVDTNTAPANSANILIEANTLIDDTPVADGGPIMLRGVLLESTTTGVRYANNTIIGATTPISAGAGTLAVEDLHNGQKWNATATVADGGSITHNFGSAPTAVLVAGSVAGEFVSVTTIGTTTFTVAIKKHDGAAGTTQTIYWMAVK